MPPGSGCYRFAEFQIDTASKRLSRSGESVPLSEHQADVLLHLLSRPGEVITKDALADAAWRGVAVTDNSVEQAISALRKALGTDRGSSFIQTVPRQGYRFCGEVTRSEVRISDADLEALLEPHRAVVAGRAALETLSREAVERALRAFAAAVKQVPDSASAHLGLANACIMHFEATRADADPDRDTIARAGHHAREACRLDPQSGDAWAALALVLNHTNSRSQSIAAARRAVSLESDNWRHHVRLAYVAWGEERLRAAHRALALFPGFALAHWLAATVYVARQAFELADRELRAGAAAQDRQHGAEAFSSVGSHWLLGLLQLADGDAAGAERAFRRELEFERDGQLYARECAANTWYALGCLRLRFGSRADAAAAFDQALARVPAHPLATAGTVMTADAPDERAKREGALQRRLAAVEASGLAVEAAIVRGVLAVARGLPEEAGRSIDAVLATAPPGNAGWLLPVDPLLNVAAHAHAFQAALARLRSRAG